MKEVKNVYFNVIFYVGLAVLTAAFYMSGREYMGQLERFDGYSVEGGAVIGVFRYCITAKNGLLFVPICAPLTAGACAEMELQSRYALFCCSRIGKRKYYVKKLLECVLPGGLMVACSEVLVLLLASARFHQTVMRPGESGFAGTFAVILLCLAEGFFNGMLWAGIGGAFAVLTRNPYIAYAFPFVIFYVLTVFQERYYRGLFFLSPRCWVDPVYYGHLFCILVLPGMCLLCSGCYIFAVKRRLDHV